MKMISKRLLPELEKYKEERLKAEEAAKNATTSTSSKKTSTSIE